MSRRLTLVGRRGRRVRGGRGDGIATVIKAGPVRVIVLFVIPHFGQGCARAVRYTNEEGERS